MLGAVELLPGGGRFQPVVGAGVDDQGVLGQGGGHGGRGAVRQGQEHHVVPGKVFHGGVHQDPVGERMQVRGDRAEALPGLRMRGDRADLYLWVRREDAQDLAAGKRSEIDHLNGYVARRGESLGVPTPVNRALWVLVKLVERERA